jgi:glutamate-5-semialdehyde dehydrogenase
VAGRRGGLVYGIRRLYPGVKVVGGLDEAVAHIGKYGSMQTEAIVRRTITRRPQRFLDEVVTPRRRFIVNASTTLYDRRRVRRPGRGEIGISRRRRCTPRPHGLEQLTSVKLYRLSEAGQVLVV